MDLGLDGHVALVTGGSKGLGMATARALIAEGARVAILARNPETLATTAREIGAYAVSADTRDEAAVRRAVDEVAAHFGRLDVVVNAAAQPASSVAGVDEPDDILAEVDTKAMGYLRVARAAVPHLRAAGGGRIVNIAGMNARSTGSVMASVRNVAVVATAKNLADELGRDNIAVTVVHPGLTRTERELTDAQQAASESNALGRTVDADEVAAIVTFLASTRGGRERRRRDRRRWTARLDLGLTPLVCGPCPSSTRSVRPAGSGSPTAGTRRPRGWRWSPPSSASTSCSWSASTRCCGRTTSPSRATRSCGCSPSPGPARSR